MRLRSGAVDVVVDGSTLRVAWRGEPLLRGALVTAPDTSDVRLTTRIDGNAFHLVVEAHPEPATPLTAAWLRLHWTVPVIGQSRAWVPHLRPGVDDVIADHAFRSPVAAVENDRVRVLLLPDVGLLATTRSLPAAFDIDLTNPDSPRLACGLSAQRGTVLKRSLFACERRGKPH